MDILSELFRDAGLRRRLLTLHAPPEDAALRFPCDRSVGFHVVLSGTLFLQAEGLDEPVALRAGDIAVMARGTPHLLAPTPRLSSLAIKPMPLEPSFAVGARAVVSGAYQLWHPPLHPMFAELPSWFVLRRDDRPAVSPLGHVLDLLADEARRDPAEPGALGRDTIVHALLDVAFTHLLREVVARQGAGAAGWCQAIGDAAVRRAVAALHADPAAAWSVETLAQAAGVSRSVLAERFRRAMGQPPLAYVRTVRLQRAMRLLGEREDTLEQVAAAVGYQDAFSFSKAFKRAVGIAPGEFRRRDAEERAMPWRFRQAVAEA